MNDTIELTDTTLDYLSIAAARQRSGLRLVLGAYAVPGPWREACKGLFYVKGIDYAPVVTAGDPLSDLQFGMQDNDRELREWTGQSSAPVAIWNDERPRASWIDQINLAERLQPEPPLIPSDINERTVMFGLINEIAGENGLGWNKRLTIIQAGLETNAPGTDGHGLWTHIADKYGYSTQAANEAPARMAAVIKTLGAQLDEQSVSGRRYFVGDRLSALDIYWATFATLFDPLPPAQCPMGTSFRQFYSNPHPATREALTPQLLAHRDFVYTGHLELPIRF